MEDEDLTPKFASDVIIQNPAAESEEIVLVEETKEAPKETVEKEEPMVITDEGASSPTVSTSPTTAA